MKNKDKSNANANGVKNKKGGTSIVRKASFAASPAALSACVATGTRRNSCGERVSGRVGTVRQSSVRRLEERCAIKGKRQ